MRKNFYLAALILSLIIAGSLFFFFSGRIFATSTCTALSSPVTFTSDVTISSDDATCDDFDITVGDGIGAVTVTIDGSHSFNSLTIKPNAVLTHTLLGTGEVGDLVLDVSSGLVDVQAGGQINLDGKGQFLSTAYQNGGTYGGRGSNSSTASYGSIDDPLHPGSKASGASGGGGYIKILADNLNIEGDILATGTYWDYGCWDGASGGGINIVADTVTGSGNISATGGPGNACGSAGGGGRIAVKYVTSLDGTVSLNAKGGCTGSCSADNNDGGAGTIYTAQVSSIGAPTPVIGTRELIIDNVDVTANTSAITEILSSHPTDYDSVILDHNARMTVQNGATVNADDFLFDNGSTLLVANGGTFDMTDGADTFTVQNGSVATFENGSTFDTANTVVDYGTLTVDTAYPSSSATVGKFSVIAGSGDSVFTLGSNGSITLPVFDATNIVDGEVTIDGSLDLTGSDVIVGDGVIARFGSVNTFDSLTVNATGKLVANNTITSLTDIDLYGDTDHDSLAPGATGGVVLKAPNGDINIYAGATIDVSEKGRYTNNTTINQGGVYGGRGHDSVAPSYGSIKTPTHPGSSVGTIAYGGGYISLESQNLDVDGDMIADGGQRDYGCKDGASGGGILIVAEVITGTGIIHANGGDSLGGGCITGPGSAGGGGRISIKYVTSLVETIDVEARGGCNVSNGCGSLLTNNGNGGAGTYYSTEIDDIVTQNPVAGTETLNIDNGIVVPSSTSLTDIGAAQEGDYDNLLLQNNSKLNILSGGGVTTEDVTLGADVLLAVRTGGAFVMSDSNDTLILDENEYVLVEEGGTLTVSDTEIAYGTMEFDSNYSESSATADKFTMTTGSGPSEFILGPNGTMTLPVFDTSNIIQGTFIQDGSLTVTNHDPVVVSDGVTYITNVPTTYDNINVSLGGTLSSSVSITSNNDFDIYGTLTHDSLAPGATGGLVAEAPNGAITIFSGGVVDTNAKGRYDDADSLNDGGSYGGRGNASPNASYGSVTTPTQPGSATAQYGNSAGLGGGYASLSALNVDISGDIDSDGDSVDYGCKDGGSGGGILIAADNITGSGTISANGGIGLGADCITGAGAGGGGGRVSLKYTNSLSPNLIIEAKGGCNITTGCASGDGAGGAGTVYTVQVGDLETYTPISGTETLTIDNGAAPADNTSFTVIDEDIFSEGTLSTLEITGGARVYLDRDLTASTSTLVGAESILSHSLAAMDFGLITGTLEVEDDGAIDVSAKGNFTKDSEVGNYGGSHGGSGLPLTGTPTNGAPATYDDEYGPLNPGQQGNGSSVDGYGGGYISMTINGNLDLNTTGKILANGSGNTNAGTGGGSGGGININVDGDILGDASAPASDAVAQIQALGGDGNTTGNNGGPGGGGRIYITYGGTNNLNPLQGVVTGGVDGAGGNAEVGTVHFDTLTSLVPPTGFTSSVNSGFQDGVLTVLSDSGSKPRLKITSNFASADGSINLSGVTLAGNNTATVVNGLAALSGAGDIEATHSLYVPNNLDSSVFVCPNATVLTAVLEDCTNVVLVDLNDVTYLGNLGNPVSSGGDTLNISLVDENDTVVALGTPSSYYLIDGLSGSGAGEQGGGGGAPGSGVDGLYQWGTQEVTGSGDVILYDVPDNFSFPAVGVGVNSNSFSNAGGTDSSDSLIVHDLSTVDAGFTVQIQANDFVGPGGATIPSSNLYVVTTPSASSGTQVNGVTHTGPAQGAAVAPLNIDEASPETLLGTTSPFTTYGSSLDNPATLMSTTDPTGTTGFETNVSFYLNVPQFQAPGVYSGQLTYTLIPN